MFILYGPEGANGKTTLMELMRSILGNFYVQAHREVFIKVDGGRAGTASPYICDLRGRRVAIFVEPELGDKINEGQIKTFTGGDRIKCRALYKSEVEFTPRFKPFLLTNHKPTCSTDPALWRRLIMIPFNCRFVDNPVLPNERLKDHKFKDFLINNEEAKSTFLNWCLIGTLNILKEELILPKIIIDATDEYREEQDTIALLIKECCEKGNPKDKNYRIQASKFYETFTSWSEENGYGLIDKKIFGTRLKVILGEPLKTSGVLYYLGVKFR